MRIERQMKSEEIHVVPDEQCYPTPPGADDARILAPPEIAVMNEHGIRASFDGGFEQCQRSRNAGNQSLDGSAAFHLQAVWGIIAKLGDFQVLSEVRIELGALHAGLVSLPKKRF
jgi:hypothetical protein